MSRRWFFVVAAMVVIVGLALPETGRSAPAPAQKIRIAVAQEPFTLEATQDSFGFTGIVIQNLYEFLMKKEHNGKLTPGLATSWKVSPDGKTIDFTLRKGVKFHSGDPLTADDVRFTFDRTRKVNPRMKVSLKAIDKIEVLDDLHVRFLLKEADVTLVPNRMGVMIVSKSYFDRVGEEKFMKVPVGTGPYKFVGYELGQYLDLERFEGYWDKKPPIREARIHFAQEDTTRVAKLQAGEVDLIQGVPFNMVKMIESSPNLKAVRLATNNPSRGVVFSTRNPNKPWHDKRVRLAMAYAIDGASMIKNVFFGVPAHWPWLAPDDLGYDPTVKTYTYDPKKAKALLAEAGYPNGFEMTLYWPIGGRVPMSAEGVQAVAGYLEAVGIRVKLEGQEADTFNATRRGAKKPTSDWVAYYTSAFTGAPDPTYTALSYFGCEGASSVYCNPEFDKILTEARETVNDAKRAELIKKLVKIMREEVPSIPIFENVAVYGMRKNVDFVPTQDRLDTVLVKDMILK